MKTPRLDDQLCFALYAATRAMTQAYRAPLEALGLTYPQYLVMLVLWERDDLSVKELGARLFLDSGTLTPLVKRLEQKKLLKRVRDNQDERRVRIRLTPEGDVLQEKAVAVPESMLCRFGDEHSSAEDLGPLREQLRDLARTLRSPVSTST